MSNDSPGLPAVFAAAPEMEATPTLRSSAQLRAVVAAREPTRWSRSFVHDWAALARWTPDALADAVPWVNARTSHWPEFVLSAPQRGQKAPFLRRLRTHAGGRNDLEHGTRNATLTELLSPPTQPPSTSRHGDTAAAAPDEREYLYYSGTLRDAPTAHWQTETLLADVQPLAPLRIADVPPLAAPGLPGAIEPPPGAAAAGELPRNRTSFRLWLSGGGVVSRTHYDKAHNLFAQVLMPPPMHARMPPPSPVHTLMRSTTRQGAQYNTTTHTLVGSTTRHGRRATTQTVLFGRNKEGAQHSLFSWRGAGLRRQARAALAARGAAAPPPLPGHARRA